MIGRAKLRRALVLLALAAGTAAAAADPHKVLHIASPDVDTLDPQQATTVPAQRVVDEIFEGMYSWGYFGATPHLTPTTAQAMPEVTDGGKTWRIALKPGIFFTDDPAFHGRRRELTAEDYVYSLKRRLDPNLSRGGDTVMTDLVIGARAVVDAAKRSGATFDYDRPIEGLRAVDRYALQIRLNAINYPSVQIFLTVAAVAREVVEAAHGDIRTRAVGTGPYRVREWKRGSKIVLEANPDYRPLRFPASDDPANAEIERTMHGKALPQIGVIDISIIEEDTTLLLEFERGALDCVELRSEPATRMLTGDRLKEGYAARGIERHAFIEPYLFMAVFNMNDPVVGGMSRERIALRRAIDLGLNRRSLVEVVYAGQAEPAGQLVPPGVTGHDPAASTAPRYDPAAARALLERFGYDRRAPDGYRNAPGGAPLTMTLSLRSGTVSREMATLWKKDMDAIGIRTDFHMTPFQDFVKEVIAGKFQLAVTGFGGVPTGNGILQLLDSRQPPFANQSRFDRPEYDRLVDRFLMSATAPEQIAAARRMNEIARDYMPLLPMIFRRENDFVQPWLLGYKPQVFRAYWHYMDIDLARRKRAN
ncbi:MAG TPA: ABC transporter substrate-binding protein [Casimicrobiaceae bacterium]|nr:ABC transporter substrate-binding protein [Casimicrobiaceae bacterium]